MSGMAAAGAIINIGFSFKTKASLLSFSTLGCPDWPFEKIVSFAAANKYKGIEVRGILRELDLTKSPIFNTRESRSKTLALMKDNGLSFVDLGSSATLHFREGAERQKNLDEGRRFIDLAAQLECPCIRVFPNNFPKEQEKQETINLIVKGMLELADHAKGSKVKVLVESHGDLVWISDLETVMKATEHEHTGMIWDITNMWTVTKESPADAYSRLEKYIHHTHIKDAKMVDGKPQYVLLGKGEVPIFEAIDLLVKNKYKGYYSFEWEKLWHPEIQEPEIALADYPAAISEHLNSVKG